MHDLGHIFFEGRELPPRKGPAKVVDAAAAPPRRAQERDAVDPFAAWLLARAGLDAADYSASSLARRTAACFRSLRVPGGEAARALVEARPELADVALSALLVGVTSFFRDEGLFARLGERLPTLAGGRGGLRVCAMGVSDGRELYSLAMLLAEAGLLERSTLLGVDCRADALARARAGRYAPDEVAGVSRERLARHFRPHPAGWALRPEITERVAWRVGTAAAPPPGPWDLVAFRNVAIYFRGAASDDAWRALAGTLAPGGLIVTGTAERPPEGLGLVSSGPCTWTR